MTQDEIIEMAKQAGGLVNKEGAIFNSKCLKAFAKLVEERTAAKERESCAAICDRLLANPNTGGGWSDATIECSVQIRARGEQHERS